MAAYLEVVQPDALAPRIVPLRDVIVIGRRNAPDGRDQPGREVDEDQDGSLDNMRRENGQCGRKVRKEIGQKIQQEVGPEIAQEAGQELRQVSEPAYGPATRPAGEREDGHGDTAEAFLCLPEHTVSRRHACLRRHGNAYFLEDLHSVNGTRLGGELLPPGTPRMLVDGDEIDIAGSALVFHALIEAAGGPPLITHSIDATRLTGGPGVAELFRDDENRRDRQDVQGCRGGRGSPDDQPPPPATTLQDAVRKLHAMSQVSIALGVVTDRAMLIEKIMNFIFDLFPLAERAFILFLAPMDGAGPHRQGSLPLVPDAARRRDGGPIDPATVRMSRTIVREVIEAHHAILSVDTLADRHLGAQASILAQPIRSVMCVPLLLEDACLGLMQVDAASDPHAFREADLEMLAGVCAEAAVTLKTFQLYTDIERLLDGFVRASVQAIEERDPATAGHSFRVAEYAQRLATAVDRATDGRLRDIAFSREQMREIRYAALLHDFGKVGVREHVLRKSKKLHHAEMLLLRQRFETARAGIEARAYRALVERHAQSALDHADFLTERLEIVAALDTERQRLDQFLILIEAANEPAISAGPTAACTASAACGLECVRDYRYPAVHAHDGHSAPAVPLLLEPFEFSALGVEKGCLTPDERRQIESHVSDSHAFLILIPWTRDLAGVPAIAHGHHEKLDGSGYPRGLKGAEISIQTRILTICDIFDALTAGDRPYKKAVPLDVALALMREECNAGHIDCELFEAFTTSQAWNPGAGCVS